MLDTVLRGARIAGADAGADAPLVDIGIAGGTIAAVEPDIRSDADSIDLGGKLVSPGLVETHIHLDKSRIVDRCAPAAGLARDHMERVSAMASSAGGGPSAVPCRSSIDPDPVRVAPIW